LEVWKFGGVEALEVWTFDFVKSGGVGVWEFGSVEALEVWKFVSVKVW